MKTATQVYAARQQEVADLLARLHAGLASHQDRQQSTPESWGHAGDLDAVARHLREVLYFLKA